MKDKGSNMQIDILDAMKANIEALGIQVMYLKSPYENIRKIDFGMGSIIYGDFDYQIVVDQIIENCRPDTIYIVRTRSYMYHTMFRFPERIEQEYGYTHCVIGPMLFQPMTQAEFRKIMQVNHIDEKYNRDLQIFYSKLPYFNSFDRWNALILSYCSQIFDLDLKLLQNHDPNNNMFSINYEALSVSPEQDFRTEVVEERYKIEKKLMSQIQKGDYISASATWSEFVRYRILPRHSDPVRNRKNLMFVVNTLFRKAAEQGNVHPVYIDELSRKIAIQIESCTTESQLSSMGMEMVRKYCLLVNNYSRSGYSKLIRDCLDYVDFHYMEPLTLTSLADQYYVSNTHLSALFKKEVNMNLKEYIQEVRLRQARFLLNTTRLPIQEIAANCGFMDVNYFTRVFRKVHGISPREYRNRIQEGEQEIVGAAKHQN